MLLRQPAPPACAASLRRRRVVARTSSLAPRELAELDSLLSDGTLEEQAVALVKASSSCRSFGAAPLIPRRDYTLADLRLHNLDAAAFLSPRDSTLEGVRNTALVAAAAGTVALVVGLHPSTEQLLGAGLLALGGLGVDAVGNNGAGEALILDSLGRATSAAYRRRVARHEAGHFLVAYLVGVLPRGFCLSTWDALQRDGLKLQAGTRLCDLAFQREVQSGALSSASLDRFCCIALAGVASEVLAFGGAAEGGRDDIQQLDALLTALAFTQKRCDSQVRWTALAVTLLLRAHVAAHDALEAAMADGKSVAECIGIIEAAMPKTS